MNPLNTKVAIVIPTMNRPDFLIRTLNYYAKIHSPHPIYIGDSSNPENISIIKTAIENLTDKLEINYSWFPPKVDNMGKLVAMVKEKYVVLIGDDDYEIPSSLTKCAEFLENNPDYSSAGGHSVTFKLKAGGPYGEIDRLADYPFYALEAETASQRLMDFTKNCYTIIFSVNRVENMRRILMDQLTMTDTWSELSNLCSCAIAGKSKLIDCLGFVRQIHDRRYYGKTMIDWITAPDFHDSYIRFRGRMAGEISRMDNIPLDRAEIIVKNAFWEYLRIYLASEQKGQKSASKSSINMSKAKFLRAKIGKVFPILKTLHHRYFPNKKHIHYDVLDPRSPYYKDFEPIWDSFSAGGNA